MLKISLQKQTKNLWKSVSKMSVRNNLRIKENFIILRTLVILSVRNCMLFEITYFYLIHFIC